MQLRYFFFKKLNRDLFKCANFKLLTGEELNIMICGTPKIDLKELMKVAIYEGFEKDSQIIKFFHKKTYKNFLEFRDFWEILAEFSEEQLKKFLFFCTGSDRIPITGIQDFIIMKHGEDSERLVFNDSRSKTLYS